MNSFKKYDTRGAANAGALLHLLGPDGKVTQDWVRVLGTDSDVFRRAGALIRRETVDHVTKQPLEYRQSPEYQDYTFAKRRELQAVLVTEWSFDEPCTHENVVAFFTAAPDVAEQVDDFAGKRMQFAVSWPTNCEPSPSSNSDSASQ